MAPVVASAPGSIMITGEHAVVYGYPAIVAAIDQRITIRLEATRDETVQIRSDIAEPAFFTLDDFPPVAGVYRFVIAVLAQFRSRLKTGLRIDLRSDIDPTLGLGSSAAVTIALLGALCRLTDVDAESIHADALAVVRAIQGRGSGADLAASLHGRCIGYQLASDTHAAVIDALPDPPPLWLRYVGYKTPTGEVLAKLAKARESEPDAFDALYAEMGRCSAETVRVVKPDGWGAAAPLLESYQDLMERLGVSDPVIDRTIAAARSVPGVSACKISGSGLGDCVLGIGAQPDGFVPARLAPHGLILDD